MKQQKLLKKLLATVVSASMVMGSLSIQWNSDKTDHVTEAATTTTKATGDQRIRVDINNGDDRSQAYHPVFHNWIITKDTAAESYTTTIDGVKFTLSDGSGTGKVKAGRDLARIKQDLTTQTLIMDGVFIDGAEDGSGIVQLTIEGLTPGKHSFKGWHAHYGDTARTTMTLTINGNKMMSGVSWTKGTSEHDLSGLSYGEFMVATGESVVVQITADTPKYGSAVLNAFEIDGVNPHTAITDAVPADGNIHYEQEGGLSWKAASVATGHAVYLGTSYDAVNNATQGAVEFKGIQTATTYAFEEQLSSIENYYWRVDEITADGVIKGEVKHFQTARLAFPSAEGYGRYARGGRGGKVVEVTNLNDSGPGSLRYAVENVSGPRIVVFRVGGVIELKSKLVINDGDIYIAGQTAPGDGITIIMYGFGMYSAEDVIMRHVRVRPGDGNGARGEGSLEMDGIGMASSNNCIVDHCSISWSTDEGHSSRGAANITFQYNIIAEALNAAGHYNGGRHAYAASIGGNKGSYHHNLLVNNTGRNWSLAGNVEADKETNSGYLDIRNNVVYNWKDRTTDGGVRRLQFVSNYYKRGAASRDMEVVSCYITQAGFGTDRCYMYVDGNMMTESDNTIILDKTQNAWDADKAKVDRTHAAEGYVDDDVRSDVTFFEPYVKTQPADEAYYTVLSGAGATMPKRDYLDTRYVEETITGTYTYSGSVDGIPGIIDSQNDVGGYPNLTGGAAPIDTDHDGMSDKWEVEHGLNPNNAEDRNGLELSPDGYTNLEMYLNELAGDEVVYNEYEAGVYEGEVYESYVPVSYQPPTPTPTPTPSPVVSVEPSVEPTPSVPASEEPSKEPVSPPAVSTEPSEDPVSPPAVSAEPSIEPVTSPGVTVTPEPSIEPVTSPGVTATPEPSAPASEEPSQEPVTPPGVTVPPTENPPIVTTSPEPTDTLTPPPGPTDTPTPPPIVLGDVDNNGQVELPDAQMALKAALKIIVLKEDEQKRADVDVDLDIDLTDAQLILKYALKIIDKFE